MTPLEIATFQPRLKVLSSDQAWAIHTAALEILEKTGLTMEHHGVLEMLSGAGCSVKDDNLVKVPSYLVEDALRSAPRQIALYDQKGNKAIPLVDGKSFYGTGSDTTFTLDLDTGERRRSRLKDNGNFAKLVDGLENMDFAI